MEGDWKRLKNGKPKLLEIKLIGGWLEIITGAMSHEGLTKDDFDALYASIYPSYEPSLWVVEPGSLGLAWQLGWVGGSWTPPRCNKCHISQFESLLIDEEHPYGNEHKCLLGACTNWRTCYGGHNKSTPFSLCLQIIINFILI
jgi:hypothetical protein